MGDTICLLCSNFSFLKQSSQVSASISSSELFKITYCYCRLCDFLNVLLADIREAADEQVDV